MADQIALLTEAHNRGILPPDKEALYQEAVRRGLIQNTQQSANQSAASGSRDASGTWMPTDKGPHAGSYIDSRYKDGTDAVNQVAQTYGAAPISKTVTIDPSQDPAAFAAQQGTTVQNLGAGYGAETLDTGHSLGKLFNAVALANYPGAALAIVNRPTDHSLQDQLFANSDSAKVGRFGADVINTAPAAMVGGEAVAPLADMVQGSGALPAILRAGITGAGQGAGAGAMMPADSLLDRLKNAGVGAGAGGAFSAAGTGIGKGLGAVRDAFTTQTSPEIKALQRLAESNGVPLTYGETTNNPFVKKLEVGLEKVPFSGMGDFRQSQSDALQAAGNKLVQGFDNTAGADPNDLIQSAAQDLLKQNKAKATQMFNGVRDLANNVSQNPADYTPLVNMNKTQAAAKDILGKFSANSDLMDQPGYLKQIAKYAEAKPRTFEEARQLRSALGTNARQAAKGAISGTTTDQENSAWQQLQRATEGDLQNFADSAGGKLKGAYNDANQFYRENVVPFKDPKLRNLVTGKMDTDTLLTTFVKNERPQLADKLYSNLTPEGQKTLKYAVLQKAMDQATAQGQNNGVAFSPAKFAQMMDKMGETKSVLFTPDELTQVNGFAKLAAAAKRAGQFAENPPTGNRLADMMAVGAGVYSPTTAVPAFVSANVLRRMLTQPWGKSLLIRAAKTNSPSSLQALATFAAGKLSQSSAVAAVRYSQRPRTPVSPQP